MGLNVCRDSRLSRHPTSSNEVGNANPAALKPYGGTWLEAISRVFGGKLARALSDLHTYLMQNASQTYSMDDINVNNSIVTLAQP